MPRYTVQCSIMQNNCADDRAKTNFTCLCLRCRCVDGAVFVKTKTAKVAVAAFFVPHSFVICQHTPKQFSAPQVFFRPQDEPKKKHMAFKSVFKYSPEHFVPIHIETVRLRFTCTLNAKDQSR